ncbi:MAG: AbiV family abortive infection protein [Candidatus Thorarchaeota archaeon]
MDKREAYQRCMTASLENAEMWLNEAKLLVKHGSRSHAHVLTLFAVEEIGKAMLCWWTINGVYPFNHPLIDFVKRKKSIFRSHSLKGGLATSFAFGLSRLFGKAPEKTIVKHPETGKDVELRSLVHETGRLFEKSRSFLMYVDIKKTCDGINVVNPLDEDPPVEIAIEDALISLATVRAYIKNTSRFVDKFKKLRKDIATRDGYPNEPEWD